MPESFPPTSSHPHSPTLLLDGLDIGYALRGRTITVARSLNACLRKGQLACLLGPNGAGKSTLLRTLAGFQPPLGGTIMIEGKPLSAYRPAQLARTVGVVLTEKTDVVNMTVLEMALMGRAPYTGFFGACSDNDRRIALEALEMVGVERLARRRVATLSDGERQKVMMAKALAQQTPLMLLDEPSAFLDYPSKAELFGVLRRACREAGLAALISTHDVPQALGASDSVWLLGQGGTFATGTPEEVEANGSLARCFPTLSWPGPCSRPLP